MSPPELSVVVATWNNLPYTRAFVESVRSNTTGSYELIVVDNASSADAAQFAQEAADVTITNESNLGFARAMNQGLEVARGSAIAFCNNDTVVPPRWADRLIATLRGGTSVGMVVPALTAATNQVTVRQNPGTDVVALNPFSPPPPGAFVLMETEVMRGLGGWGEEFGLASGEDLDLAFKVWVNDLEIYFDERVLVEHVDKGTARHLDDWPALWARTRRIFLEKWMATPGACRLPTCAPERHRRNLATAASVAEWMSRFFAVRDASRAPTSDEGASNVRSHQTQLLSVENMAARLGPSTDVDLGVRELPAEPEDGKGPFRVTYVVPKLMIAGGVLGVVQLVNELTLMGVDARLVAWDESAAFHRWHLVRPAIVYSGPDDLLEQLDVTDVIVATHFSTARLAYEAVRRGLATTSAYFLQDYEPWFWDEERSAERQSVRATFDLVPNKIVKSEWLAELLAEGGHPTKKIHLGMDLGFFYPRDVPRTSRPLVVSMARPRTPRRGFETVVETLRLVHERHPSVRFALFGQDLDDQVNLPFPCQAMGEIAEQERVAELFSSATAHFDGSDFQAFGRPALEGMACGAPSVLTDVGGVREYAVHEHNCLLVPPRSPELAASSILRLLGDEQLRNRLTEGGFRTVAQFSLRREGRDTLEYFRRIHVEASSRMATISVGRSAVQCTDEHEHRSP